MITVAKRNRRVLTSRLIVACFFMGAVSGYVNSQPSPQGKRMNVLFIAVDDLRPELRAYGKDYIHSPNIDALAANGLLFERAYCQQAVCSPSRTSLLTGLRPDATGVYDLTTHFRKNIPDVITLPQHFKNNGYHTEWWGKIYHGALHDDPSWTVPEARYNPGSNWRGYALEENKKLAAERKGIGPAFESADVEDNVYPDGIITDGAMASLQKLAKSDQPFFLAVGLLKPHLPFNAPKKYWDLYDTSGITLPEHQSLPDGAPEFTGNNSGELRQYAGIPDKGPLSRSESIRLIHGYRACVSSTDAQVGRLMEELKRTGLDKNTIVILWGDHGWKLSDYGLWAKHTNFEVDTRAPLIVSTPQTQGKGIRTRALVEFIDIYPSLCELAGLPLPDHLQGKSFVPLFNDPQEKWKSSAFSQYPRGDRMGYSMRTDRYRFTQWQKKQNPLEVVALELYDLQKDPNGFVNIAYEGRSKRIVAELSKKMREAGIGTTPIR